MISIEELREKSGLPGPRGNLELLYQYIDDCSLESTVQCMAVIQDDTSNSPDEFVGMCGVVGFAVLIFGDQDKLIEHLQRYATHSSWRIRESVAIAIQEMPAKSLEERIGITSRMEDDDPLVCRAIVAGLCEPKNLRNQRGIEHVYLHLVHATRILRSESKLTEGETALRRALGYCWSVALAEFFEEGKNYFEDLITSSSKNIRWIVSENLKKKRLSRKNREWVEEKIRQLSAS